MPLEAVAFPRLTLGISSCLLGEPVRYDGGHKRHAWLNDVLAGCADYVPVCPEAAIGMGVPRPPVRLVGSADRVRALGVEDPGMDVTERLQTFARRQADELAGIDGYIFKKNSPSCGLARVKLFSGADGRMQRKATGLYAAGLVEALPLLPVAQEDTFDNAEQRDNFMTRVYVYRRWRRLAADGFTGKGLTDFHALHEYLLMARSRAAGQRLGHLLADSARSPIEELATRYIAALMEVLKRTSQRRQHCNALQHIAGHLERRMTAAEKAVLSRLLEDYARARCDRWRVIDALRAGFDRYADSSVARQVYLNPYPDSLR